jgi:hypothetical protein
MIGRAYSYVGSEADARRLDAHLWKDDGQRPELSDVRNLLVHDTGQGMAVLAALKAASNAKIAFWHIIVSPRKTLNQEERDAVVDLIIAEFAAGEHPLMVFSHNDKPRARKGGGANHLHLLLGHVSPVSFRALNMRQHAPRLHKVMALTAYQVEGVATASPWHKSIVGALRAEGHPHVADWLVDSLGEAPIIKAPRMTDSMRRSAQRAKFPLPFFQAGLERCWNTGAAQSEFGAFLSQNEVVIRAARSPTVIAFYHGALFVGALHRILRQDSKVVYEEAKRRFPQMLGASAVQALSDVQSSGIERPKLWEVPGPTRRRSLDLQRKVDDLEDKLASLRVERLHLIYQLASGSSPRHDPVSEADFLLDPDRQSRAHRDTPNRQNAPVVERSRLHGETADRIKRLLHAEAVLDTAVMLLWMDPHWMGKSSHELLRFAKRVVNSGISNVAGGGGSSARDAQTTEEEFPTVWGHP